MRPTRTRKSPIYPRSFILAAGLFLFVAAVARPLLAQNVLNEARVVQRARAHATGAVMGRASRTAADAAERGAGALPNPSVAWERETTGNGGPVQDTFHVTVPLALVRPSAERALATADAEMLRADGQLEESAAVGQALALWFEWQIVTREAQILEEELASFEDAARTLERRSAAGGASGYEAARVKLEAETCKSRLHTTRANLDGIRARLASVLNLSSTEFRADAELNLRPLPPADQLIARAMTSRRHVVHARRAATAANTARDRSGRLWIPDVSVHAGLNAVRDDSTQYGYVAGLSVDIPVFSRGQELQARADAQHALAYARATTWEREVRAQVVEAHAAHEAARNELQRFRAAAMPHATVLVQAARSGYREGARSVVELLDAERAYVTVAQTELAIMARGKQAELRLRMATGEW
jgi:cobalt-zinc-cadmium efflux system outer membrane protein